MFLFLVAEIKYLAYHH